MKKVNWIELAVKVVALIASAIVGHNINI